MDVDDKTLAQVAAILTQTVVPRITSFQTFGLNFDSEIVGTYMSILKELKSSMSEAQEE